MNDRKYWISDLLLLTLILSVLYFLFLGHHPLLVPDEGRYSEIAREMWVSGNYITPRVNGIVFLDKPALYYWLQALAMHFFGVHEWSLRFWPAVSGIFGCLIIYITGRVLYNRRTAWYAAMILASCPLYFFMAHYANMDLEVAVWITATLCCFIMAVNSESSVRRSCLLWLAYIFAALAMLTKGLMGIVFPMMIIGMWILLLNRWSLLKNMRLFSGLLLFVMICAPWYILAQRATPQFFNYFFIVQQFSRYVSSDFNNLQPFWFYILVVLMGTAPWSFFIALTATQHVKNSVAERKKYDKELFFLLWFLLIFIFFSIPHSKLIGYIVPVLPPFSMLMALFLVKQLEKPFGKLLQFTIACYLVTAIVLIVGLNLLGYRTFPLYFEQPVHAFCVTALLLLAGVVAIIYCSKKKLETKIFPIMALSSILALCSVLLALPHFKFTSTKELAVALKPRLQPADILIMYDSFFADLPLYLQQPLLIAADWNDPKILNTDSWRREFHLGLQFDPGSKKWLLGLADMVTLWQHSQQRIFVFIPTESLPVFTDLTRPLPYYVVEQYKGISVISNKMKN